MLAVDAWFPSLAFCLSSEACFLQQMAPSMLDLVVVFSSVFAEPGYPKSRGYRYVLKHFTVVGTLLLLFKNYPNGKQTVFDAH